jgi:hypothetical protein
MAAAPGSFWGYGGFVHIICYGGIAGTFGGMSVLLAKSTVEIAKNAITYGGTPFKHIESYVLVGGMLASLMMQIIFLNEGLRRFDALLMVPVYQSFWIISSVLGGIMYFQEYRMFSILQGVMFISGTCITMSGIGYLLRDRSQAARRPRGNSNVKFQRLNTSEENIELMDTSAGIFDDDHFDSALDDGDELYDHRAPVMRSGSEDSGEPEVSLHRSGR